MLVSRELKMITFVVYPNSVSELDLGPNTLPAADPCIQGLHSEQRETYKIIKASRTFDKYAAFHMAKNRITLQEQKRKSWYLPPRFDIHLPHNQQGYG